jgi:hypothetical protein
MAALLTNRISGSHITDYDDHCPLGIDILEECATSIFRVGK